jgi:hypothetical protein
VSERDKPEFAQPIDDDPESLAGDPVDEEDD